MTISDRNRKILWAKAGNRCSKCRCELVWSDGQGKEHAIIGEECHIISPRPAGPRGTPTSDPEGDLDAYENLVLLCPLDHSLVDQLVDEFSVNNLRAMRSAHESWVTASLARGAVTPVVFQRWSLPLLAEVPDATALLSIVACAHESSLGNDDLVTEAEVEEVGGLLQTIFDYGEFWDDLELADRVRATFEVGQQLATLRQHGWRVFGARSRGAISGGVSSAPSPWDTAYVKIVREDSVEIVGLSDATSEPGEDPSAPPTP